MKDNATEIFLNGVFKEKLLIILQKLSDENLISTIENQLLQGVIKNCQTFKVASAVIKLEDESTLTFVYNDQNSFILSNIEEGKPFIPFSSDNVDKIILCLFS